MINAIKINSNERIETGVEFGATLEWMARKDLWGCDS